MSDAGSPSAPNILNLDTVLFGWLDETTEPLAKSTLPRSQPKLHRARRSENELVVFFEFAIVLGAETW